MPDPQTVLAEALDAVARDLGPVLDAQTRADLLEDAVAHRAWWLQQWPDGAPHVPGLLAQDVQEAVHDAAPTDARARLWPLCPEHGDHALHVEPDLGPDPFWVCSRSGLPVASVGTLPHP